MRTLGLLIAVAVVAFFAQKVAHHFWPGAVRTGDADAHGATITRYELRSRFVHRTLKQVAVTPRGGGRGRPLLVFLHGRGGGGEESNANGDFLAALGRLGDRAPDVVFPNGADHSYWHSRRSGDWARYVLDEVIPEAVRRLHSDPKRIAIGGISMGGFGAFDIARLRPREFCAVGGHSAALWLSGGDTAAGAFDDAEDFARHDLIGVARRQGRSPWGTARLWLDGGTEDPFRAGGEALASAVGIRMHHWPGAHEGKYWRAHFGSYLRFYADALAVCLARAVCEAGRMTVIAGLDFVGIPSQDAERARAFYGETLGLRQDPKATYEFWIGETCVAIWEPERQGMPFAPQKNAPLALHVEDVATARAELEAKGVEFSGETLDTGVCHMALFTDPDGNDLMLHRRYAPRE